VDEEPPRRELAEREVADRPPETAPAANTSSATASSTQANPAASVDLSPLSAARTGVDVYAAPTHAPAVFHADERADDGTALNDYLARASLNPTLTRAEDPKLLKTRDGYEFAGNGFDAEIKHDGSVHFADRYGQAGFVMKPEMRPDGSVNFVILRVSFDLTAWAEHLAGNDPYRSERRWFLERTAELRERLAQAAFRAHAAKAESKLLRALRAIWSATSKGLAWQKRSTFELWDECADDEVGTRCRRIVEAHIGERCPLESACAFTPTDLVMLNQRRKTRRLFAPYGAGAEILSP
jgi:hypothetical protein